MLWPMRRGISKALALAVLVLCGACATEGVQDVQFDANPVHAPGAEQVGDTYDALTEGTAEIAAEVLDGLLTPITVLFDAAEAATSPYPVTTSPTLGMNAEERQSWRRRQMGLPESAEARVAARRSQVRTRMGLAAQPK